MKLHRLKKMTGYLSLCLILGAFIAFVEKKNQEKTFRQLEVEVEAVSGVYFVEEKEIFKIIEMDFPELKLGLSISEIPLFEIEKRLIGHPFIKSAEASIEQKGIVKIQVQQHEPIARIARPMKPDGYITTEGMIIPTSPTYTSRVLILQGKYMDRLMDMGGLDKMPELLPLLKYVTTHEFWNAQITEMEINSPSNIRLHQQVGKQVIEFGDAMDFESKFKRVEILYKEILPRKGWNAYERVSVKFKNQIVCE